MLSLTVTHPPPQNPKSTLTFKYQIDIRIVLWELINWMFVAVTL